MINREQLVKVLEAVSLGLAQKEIVEQTKSFLFLEDSIASYNDNVTVRCPFKSGIRGAVKSAELLAVLQKMKDEEVELSTSEKGNELIVSGKRTKSGISMESEMSLPLDEVKIPKEFKPLSKNFSKASRACLFATSQDMTRPVLTCVHYSGKTIEATDSFTIAIYETDTSMDESLVPAKFVREIVNHDMKEYAISKGWIHFKDANKAVFSCRVMTGEFPKVSAHVKITGSVLELPSKLEDMLDRAKVFCSDEFEQDKQVFISVAEGSLRVSIRGKNGWLKDRTKSSYTGEDIAFHINPEFLLEAMHEEAVLTVGNQALLMKGKGFVHAVKLVIAK